MVHCSAVLPPSFKYSVFMHCLGLGECLGLWVSQSYSPIHLCLIPPSETSCFPDSTQKMFRPHSKRGQVCDRLTGSDFTRTAPMSTKLLDRVLAEILPTSSDRIR